MADLGAKVIKIEPLAGDPFRAKPVQTFIRATQGKESIALDLKRIEGQQILHRLVRGADALMHNYRLGVPARLGADYETLHAINSKLVYVYTGAYGSRGPDAPRAGFNPTVGAFTGNSVFQSGDGNIPVGDPSADPMAGSAVATAVMLGLAARWRTGMGQYLETTMINSVVFANSDDAFDYAERSRRRNPDRQQFGLEATYRLYEASEGWVFLACPADDEFSTFCATVGLDELINDPKFLDWPSRYEHREALGAILERLFRTGRASEWEANLSGASVGCVQADRMGYQHFLYDDPHARAIGFMVPTRHPDFESQAPEGRYWRHRPALRFGATPCEPGKPFASLGQHTAMILDEIGYSQSEIDRLAEQKVVGIPESVGRI